MSLQEGPLYSIYNIPYTRSIIFHILNLYSKCKESLPLRDMDRVRQLDKEFNRYLNLMHLSGIVRDR
jgi:hypothetical protein